MTLRSQIGNDLNSLSPDKLAEAYRYISGLKKDDIKEKPFFWKRLHLMIKAKSFPMLAGSSDSTPEAELTSGEE